jgi:crossover junction endodeoxyribonuclease RuvC
MRVFGVDPGLTRCGVGVLDVDNRRKATFVHVNVIRTEATLELAHRLGILAEQLSTEIDQMKPDVIVIERVFSQLNVRTAMSTAQASAVAMLAAHQRDLPVKAAVTGSGRADKKQVTQMVARHLNLAELPKPADAADALALALCHGWRGVGQQRIVDQAIKFGIKI